MLSAIIGVVGTLLGAGMAGLLHHLTAGRAERLAARLRHRDQVAAAARNLAAALIAYRRHAYIKINMRREGITEGMSQARIARYEAHSALTGSLVALRLTLPGPQVVAAAEAAVQASLALRDAAPDTVDVPRLRTQAADEAFLDAAAHALTR